MGDAFGFFVNGVFEAIADERILGRAIVFLDAGGFGDEGHRLAHGMFGERFQMRIMAADAGLVADILDGWMDVLEWARVPEARVMTDCAVTPGAGFPPDKAQRGEDHREGQNHPGWNGSDRGLGCAGVRWHWFQYSLKNSKPFSL